MKLISHRGNISGKNERFENNPFYLIEAMNVYDVELDVWYINDKIYLGHDKPQYQTDIDFLISNKQKIWAHAKNINALQLLIQNKIHCFWHQEDKYTLTSNNYIWCYPGSVLIENSVAVLPESVSLNQNLKICYAICSDYISNYEIL